MLELRYDPDPILTQVCVPVAEINAEIRSFAEEMIQTMYAEHGIGLAAPQVGRAIRMFVMDVDWPVTGKQDPKVFINPEFQFKSPQKALMPEGCLSFPEREKQVWRHLTVVVRARDIDGNPFMCSARDLESRCIQHEHDHLDGKTLYEIIPVGPSPAATTPPL